MKEDEQGLDQIPPLKVWRCPECAKTTPVEQWEECEIECESCGGHIGRRCPSCHEEFDSVWGYDKIAQEQKRI